jgi:hypothetical protein
VADHGTDEVGDEADCGGDAERLPPQPDQDAGGSRKLETCEDRKGAGRDTDRPPMMATTWSCLRSFIEADIASMVASRTVAMTRAMDTGFS